MSRLNVGNLFNENEDGAPVVSGISTFSSPNYFVPPSGSTAQRPQNPGEGMIRFNTDSGHLEYYTGTHWADVITNNNELGDQNNSNSSGGTGTRAFFAGGQVPGNSDVIDFITIATLGDAQDFGNLTEAKQRTAACASNVTGIIAGGYTTGFENKVEKITFASTGNAVDTSGNLTVSRNRLSSCSNQTRGLFLGGNPGSAGTDTIDYITISSAATVVDFGNLTTGRQGCRAVASAVRGVCAGGISGSNPYTYQNIIDYVTISSTGDAQDFGDLSRNSSMEMASASNSTRGIFAGGYNPSPTLTYYNEIDFITTATTGNSQDFGDLTVARADFDGTSSPTRAIFGGGETGSRSDVIDYVEISSTGNAIDFGNLSVTRRANSSSSNGHGGL